MNPTEDSEEMSKEKRDEVLKAWDNKKEKPKSEFEPSIDLIDLHGLVYIFLSEQTKCGRMFWMLIVVMVLILSVFWIIYAYLNWYNNPVVTTVDTTGYSIKNLEYPAVTFCNQGYNDVVLIAGFLKQFFGFLMANNVNPKVRPYHAANTIAEWNRNGQNSTLLSIPSQSVFNALQDLFSGPYYGQFLNKSFPGLIPTDDVIGLLKLLASSNNPRAIIAASVSNSGGYDQCAANTLGIKPNKTKKSQSSGPCGSNFAADTVNNVCYRTLRNVDNFYQAKQDCIRYDAEVVQFENDGQVNGLIALLNAGNLTLPSESQNFFFLWATRDPFTFNEANTPINVSFANLNVQPDDGSLFCLTALYVPNTSKFNLYQADCTKPNGTICRKPLVPQVDCSTVNKTWPTYSALEYNMNPALLINLNTDITALTQVYRDIFNRLDSINSVPAVLASLWYSRFPCFDVNGISSVKSDDMGILKYCEWKGQEIPCAAIFETFPTDKGMCCSFNIASAEEIFQGKMYSKLIEELQQYDKNNSVDSTVAPNTYTNAGEPNVQAGQGNGLVVLLDAHTDLVAPSSVLTDNLGFFGTIGARRSLPLLTMNDFIIRPGHVSSVGISATVIDADEQLRSLSPTRRGCKFEDEIDDLKFHKYYSQSNCLFECTIIYAQNQMEDMYNFTCLPWYFPSLDSDLNFCDPWEVKQFNEFNFGTIPDSTCNYCLPDCSTVKYDTTISATPFRHCDDSNLGVSFLCNLYNQNLPNPKIFGEDVENEFLANPKFKSVVPGYVTNAVVSNMRTRSATVRNGGIFSDLDRSYDAYEIDMARVEIYFNSPTAIKLGSSPTMTWVDYLSQVGGLLGLCVGASLVTFVELIWLCLRYVSSKHGYTHIIK